MYTRKVATQLASSLAKYKIVTLIGPRQSGKTTLAKLVGREFDYYNLEDLSFRARLIADPKGFFESIGNDVIFDEVQQWPDLLSYLQVYTDSEDSKFRFILTGSNSLLLSDQISQSLAGRARIFQILPLSYQELPEEKQPTDVSEAIFKGLYPRIYWQDLDAQEWISDYVQTYIQKDVRQIINIENLMLFDRFLRLLAGRVGQVLNYSSLAGDVGVSVPTIKSWIGILEASFIVYQLWPHHQNFNKRIIKSPKLYFYDTGIVSFLLRIHDPAILDTHPLRGSLFENWVINEKLKSRYAEGKPSPYYFWRDQHGHEVDLVEDKGTYLKLIEIKSSATFHPSFADSIKWLNNLQNKNDGEIIYGGAENFQFETFWVKSWKTL